MDLDDENKAVFKIDFEGDEKLQSAIITQDQLEAVKESAIVCPVEIKIYDLKPASKCTNIMFKYTFSYHLV